MRIEPELEVYCSHGCVFVWFDCHNLDSSCVWTTTVKDWLEGIHEES